MIRRRCLTSTIGALHLGFGLELPITLKPEGRTTSFHPCRTGAAAVAICPPASCPSRPGPAHRAPSQTASSPQAVCAAAAGAHTAPPSSSCPGTPGPGPLDPTPGNSPALPPSAGRYARRRGPASTPAAAAWSAWPPATSEPAPAQAGIPAYRVAGHVQLLGNPPDRTASAFHFVDLFHLSHLQQCVSRTSVPPSAMCFTHLCPTFSNVFHAPLSHLQQCVSRTSVPPSAMCFTHLCPTFSNVFHAPLSHLQHACVLGHLQQCVLRTSAECLRMIPPPSGGSIPGCYFRTLLCCY